MDQDSRSSSNFHIYSAAIGADEPARMDKREQLRQIQRRERVDAQPPRECRTASRADNTAISPSTSSDTAPAAPETRNGASGTNTVWRPVDASLTRSLADSYQSSLIKTHLTGFP